MSKNGYLSADDFLSGITGEAVDLEIAGLGKVKVRALEYRELQKIDREGQGDSLLLALLMVMHGMVEPQIGMEHLEAMQKARPGIIRQIAEAVRDLSGMGDDMEKKAGNGS